MSEARTRSQHVPMPEKQVVGRTGLRDVYEYDVVVDYPLMNSYECTCVDQTNPGPPYKTGGGFDLLRFQTEMDKNSTSINVSCGWYFYDGCFNGYHAGYLSKSSMAQSPSWGDVSDWGAAGWNRYRPTRPRVSLGVALAELREFPQMLRSTAKSFSESWKAATTGCSKATIRQAGDTWLNANFGWLPFLSDLRDFYETTRDLNKHLRQLERDNGRWIRRGGPLYSNSDTQILVDTNDNVALLPALSTYLYAPDSWNGTSRVTETLTQNIWFAGAFRYFIPPCPKWMWNLKAYSLLYGLRPSPSLLYELTPWSWLVDWCSNTGDMIEMLSSILTEDLCAKYAYVMGHTVLRRDLYASNSNFIGGVSASLAASATLERKQRVPASEFGFGLTDNSFTARQWSILGALGLSRF